MPNPIVGLGAVIALVSMPFFDAGAWVRQIAFAGDEPGSPCFESNYGGIYGGYYLYRCGPIELQEHIGGGISTYDECLDGFYEGDFIDAGCYVGDDGEYMYACISSAGGGCTECGYWDYMGGDGTKFPISGYEDWTDAGNNRVSRPALSINFSDVDEGEYYCEVYDWDAGDEYACDIGAYWISGINDSSLVCEKCPSTGVSSIYGTTDDYSVDSISSCYAPIGSPFSDTGGIGVFEGGDCYYQ